MFWLYIIIYDGCLKLFYHVVSWLHRRWYLLWELIWIVIKLLIGLYIALIGFNTPLRFWSFIWSILKKKEVIEERSLILFYLSRGLILVLTVIDLSTVVCVIRYAWVIDMTIVDNLVRILVRSLRRISCTMLKLTGCHFNMIYLVQIWILLLTIILSYIKK